ncbi:MAG: putative dsRNA-binding protein, partial [Bifidobacterium psychraerophilum]
GEPRYRMQVSGPEYQQIFTATVFLGEEENSLAEAQGSSKRKAQLAAAQQAWHSLSEHGQEHGEAR